MDLSDPANFLHRIDPVPGRATFVRTSREQLRSASFLDGRATLSASPAEVPIGVLRVWAGGERPIRLILHVGFCGSTHLSRLLESSDRVMVLREPQAMTDLATHWAAATRQDIGDAILPDIFEPAARLLGRRWQADSPVVLKLSNWANVLLPTVDPSSVRAVAVTSTRRQFLTALLRGGPERLGYAGRAAAHFSSGVTSSARLVSQVLAEDWALSHKLLVLGGIAHAIQTDLIGGCLKRIAISRSAVVSLSETRDDPRLAVARAAAALDVPPPPAGVISSAMMRYSKNPSERFDAAAARALDADLERRHRESLASAEDWLLANIGIDRPVTQRDAPSAATL